MASQDLFRNFQIRNYEMMKGIQMIGFISMVEIVFQTVNLDGD